MADNYLQYSVEVTGLTDEEIAWFQQALTWDLSEEQEKAEAQGADPDTVTPPGWWDDYGGSCGTSYELDKKGREILLYAEESGNVGGAAELLFTFVTTYRPDAIYVIEWAETCSRMRPGQFGGGACVVSREGILMHGAGEWASRMRRKIEAWRAAEARDKREGPRPDGVDVAQQRLRVAEAARGYCDGDGSIYGDARSLLEDILVDTHQTLDRETPAVLDRIVGAALDKHAFDIPEETEDGI